VETQVTIEDKILAFAIRNHTLRQKLQNIADIKTQKVSQKTIFVLYLKKANYK